MYDVSDKRAYMFYIISGDKESTYTCAMPCRKSCRVTVLVTDM